MGKRTVNSLSLYITTLCNLHCMDCCAGTQTKGNMSLDELDDIAKYEYNRIIITGGEPTLHKKFREIVKFIVSNVKYKHLTLATNGFKINEYIDLIDHFDMIRFSRYDKNSYPNSKEDNGEVISKFQKTYKGKVRIAVLYQQMIALDKKNKPCKRGSSDLGSYFKGKVYGCCVAAGIMGAKGIDFDNNWSDSVNKAELPCKKCVFAW